MNNSFYRCLLFIAFMLISACSEQNISQVNITVNVPENTPEQAKLSFGGDFNGWDPTNKHYQLSKDIKSNTYHYTFENFPVGKVLNYKVTRGTWDNAEVAEDGSNRENRRYTVKPGKQAITITVADWVDLTTKEVPSTIVGRVIIEAIELPTFAGQRKLRIYLPADYDQSQLAYPVIYMTDAQNLYDSKTASAGEWQMDELMMTLTEQGAALNSIVVGIDHAGENRGLEYMPFNHQKNSMFSADKSLHKGTEFADWLVLTLKPQIDQRFRTKPQREFTTMIGSSMGGLISCYTALRHQQYISKVACLSSAFLKRLVGDNLLDFIKQTEKQYPMKIYMDMGDNEFGLFGPDILDETQQIYDALLATGFKPFELNNQVISGGTHDEPSWRIRTKKILQWLNTTR